MKRILITGANGYLGGKLTKYIIENTELDVVAVASSEEKIRKMLDSQDIDNTRVSFFSNDDLTNSKVILPDLYGAVHLAFARRSRPAEEIASSIDFAYKVFQRLFSSSVERIVNVSSQGIYGNTDLFRKETTVPAPSSSYTMAKYATERILEICAGSRNKDYTSLRLDLVTQNQNVIVGLCKQAIHGKVFLRGGEQRFSFIDADDAVAAVTAMLLSPVGWSNIYNVGWNKLRYTLVELAEIIADVTFEYGLKRPEIILDKQDISLWAGMDSTKFMKKTGWEPKIALKDTVRESIARLVDAEKIVGGKIDVLQDTKIDALGGDIKASNYWSRRLFRKAGCEVCA